MSNDKDFSSDLSPLTPPEMLTAPKAVPSINPDQGRDMTPLSDADKARLAEMARAFVQDVSKLDAHGEGFKRKLDSVHALGMEEQRSAAQVSNRMLERPLRATKAGVFDEGSSIIKGLTDLRHTVEELDPSRGTPAKRFFGLLPGGKKVQGYMERYASAQDHLNAILDTLYRSQDELRKDNASIETEKVALWTVMQKLRQYAYVGQAVDDALTERLAVLENENPEKARMVREELLFSIRQRVTDLLTQLAVSVQGYLALDLVRKNNLELVKGVDRATTTTISALRTAVLVSQALGTQQMVLEQVTALNTTTGNMIESTSQLLKTQTTRIQEGAGSATVNVEQLQNAFKNVYAALDAISEYKVRALENFRQTTQILAKEVGQAQSYLDKGRQQASQEIADSLDVESSLVSGGELKL
ncbi:toxic anion resistance protein [Deinococcus sp.]|uniref:toxic anion resistance protein n=1 Tax=Deinococcus sp. TaxID=47478 RepID=UPI0025F6DF4F|nr:toxic anion resistance protein [Deinococcus sp.]